ncbi:MAG: GGDEF domain-containing protein [Burkholderiales bacterium]|nr:GGDEF domain-containing protein [Burkholderiales bacterium]
MSISGKGRIFSSPSLTDVYPELVDNQHVSVLKITIWVMLAGAVALIATLSISPGSVSPWRVSAPALLLVLALAAHLVLRYRGAIAAMRLLTVGGWALATAVSMATEGVRTPILLSYPMLVIFSGWMLGARYGVGLYIASSIAVIAMAIGQSMDVFGGAASLPPAVMALAYLVAMTLSVTMTIYLVRSFHQSYAQYRILTENIKDVVGIMDTETLHFRYLSPSVQRLLGYTPQELLAVPATHALGADAGARLSHLIRSRAQSLLSDGALPRTDYTDEVKLSRKDGSTVWTEVISSYYRNPDNGRVETRGVARDIGERKQMELALRELATTDFLTGISNRRHFIAQLDHELLRLQRLEAQRAAVLMLDLDHFKGINDRFGHATGDAMLKHFVTLMRRELRSIDTAGRVGGEEFSIILPGADLAGAQVFAERLRLKVSQTPLVQDGEIIPVTVSIGIAALGGADSDAALDRADQALYRAKKSGRNRVELAGVGGSVS